MACKNGYSKYDRTLSPIKNKYFLLYMGTKNTSYLEETRAA
jgi:hypothetical protein